MLYTESIAAAKTGVKEVMMSSPAQHRTSTCSSLRVGTADVERLERGSSDLLAHLAERNIGERAQLCRKQLKCCAILVEVLQSITRAQSGHRTVATGIGSRDVIFVV